MGKLFEPYLKDARPHWLAIVDGQIVSRIDGVSMPSLEAAVHTHLPEGMLEDEENANLNEGDDED